jgi:hypothetical protein
MLNLSQNQFLTPLAKEDFAGGVRFGVVYDAANVISRAG